MINKHLLSFDYINALTTYQTIQIISILFRKKILFFSLLEKIIHSSNSISFFLIIQSKMGAGSSRKVNRQTQVPSALKTRPRTPSPPPIKKVETYSRRPYSSQPSPWLKQFDMKREQSTSSLAQYASIWEHNGKV